MKRICTILGLLAALAAVSAPAFAQNAQNDVPLLVDVDWLSQHLDDRDLVLLHVGNRAEYDAEHIPGARLISDGDVTQNAMGLMYELPPVQDLRAKFASFGVSDDSRIVLYFGKDGGLQSTTRVIFTLDYLGLGGRTSLLNGGISAWKRGNKQVTAAQPKVTPGKLSARPTKNLVTDAEFVKSIAQRPGHRLVDARAAVFYSGIQETNGKSGHIPGAVNIPFSQILDSQLMIDRRRIEELFRGAGIKEGETIVGYCHIGQQATAMIFGARLLGHPVMLYDGSFTDWATNNRGPVEK